MQGGALVPYGSGWTSRVRGLVASVVLLVLAAAAGVLVLGILRAETGDTGLVVGAALAFLPVVVVVAAFLWLDRWEPEPARHLVQAFAWGATVAALVSVVVNSTAALALQPATVATAVAPVVEEASKGLFVVGFAWLHRAEFDGVVDGIVLAGLTGAGFAFTENILYFGRAWTAGLPEAGDITGVQAAGATFLARGVMSPFAHPLFTGLLGLAVGIAAMSASRLVRVTMPVLGYAAAVGLHALWNGAALLGGGSAFVMVYVTVMVPVFLAAVGLAVWSRRREGGVLARQLPAFAAAGWLSPWEVHVLSSMPLRRRALREARGQGQRPAAGTRAYVTAATELAFLRERLVRRTAPADALRRQDALLGALAAARPRAHLPAPPTTGRMAPW